MTPLFIFLLMIVILCLGAPISFALLISGLTGLYLVGGMPIVAGFLETVPLSAATGYELITIPMFLVMAELLIVSGITTTLFQSVAMWVSRLPGGLAIAVAIAGAGFGALCGSSAASAATLSAASMPTMIRNKYKPELAAGVVAISGTLAMLIPPSVALVLYGYVAQVSIGKLLIAGIVPGLMVMMLIIATVLILVAINPASAPRGPEYTLRERIWGLRQIGPAVVLIFLVTGTIYGGFATPTEASAIGASGALILALASRTSIRNIVQAFVRGTRTTCMVLLIILCGHIFSYYFTITQTTTATMNWVMSLDLSSTSIMLAILLLLIVLGCFIDSMTILILTVPILLPIIVQLGYDPIWFGILTVVAAEVGVVTPPLGINVFVVAKTANRSVEEVFRGVTPHIIAHIFILLVFLFFPQLILWLPSQMNY